MQIKCARGWPLCKKGEAPFGRLCTARDGGKCMRTFSVAVYGEDGARQLALESRKQMVMMEIGRQAELSRKTHIQHQHSL